MDQAGSNSIHVENAVNGVPHGRARREEQPALTPTELERSAIRVLRRPAGFGQQQRARRVIPGEQPLKEGKAWVPSMIVEYSYPAQE